MRARSRDDGDDAQFEQGKCQSEEVRVGGVIRAVHAYFDAAGLKSVSEAVG